MNKNNILENNQNKQNIPDQKIIKKIDIPMPYEFRVMYCHQVIEKLEYRIIGVGQAIPDIGSNWIVVGIDQYTGLNDEDRKVFAGDIYRFVNFDSPITVSFNQGFRFMFGKFGLNKDIIKYGQYLGTVYDQIELEECSTNQGLK